ncbi:MAG: CBS domain-containing protein [Chloroflexi bacterium]|nr:CBS domain-containing protein [Chloroflexota bacterium]
MNVILTHEHADFDALASLLAASKLYEATPVLPRKLNRNLRDFLVLYRSSLPFKQADELPRGKVEMAILVDTQTAQAVKGMTQDTRLLIIDHHRLERELPENAHFWGEPVGATTTILLEQIINRGIPLSPIEATLLLLGIYEDTGGLTYASTTPRDLRCAAWLLEHGANLEVANSFLHHPLTPAQQTLLKQLSDNAETIEIAGHTIVIATAKAKEYVDEISTLAHKLRDLFDPDGLFLIVELDDRVQLVARSTTNHIHVGRIAEALGGGGHARAAAAPITHMTLSEVREKLLEILKTHVRPPLTVRNIMTEGEVKTFSPNMSVIRADREMKRLGHEGFPVVENGRLVGLVTRRDIDRALHHHFDKEPIRRVMRAGQVTVRPDDSVQTLQKVMMESGWGQVPVVDEQGRMVGIVTRTDLLKLWGAAEERLAPPSVALKMEAALPEGLLKLLRDIGDIATELHYSLYAVGGFVRDLLLGRPNYDVDLVVEGDAAQLAHTLAKRFGGRVRTHKRFGTAKWIRDEKAFAAGKPLPDQTPASLDFATARTEFYEEATALPVVESSNIKLDLHRRDFTINTLAIRLDGPHWGELLDFYGGCRDLEEGLIRVLHSLSFVEDPTRILRAVRFEQRFGFKIESRTAELIHDAVDLLARVSGPRIRHEFDLIFQERQPEKVMARLHELGVFQALHPELTWNDALAVKFQNLRAALRETPLADEAIERLYFALWLHRLSPQAQREVLDRLRANARTRALIEEGIRLRGREKELLAPDLLPSRLDQLLAPFSDSALLIARIDADDWSLSQRILDYMTHLRPQKIELTGDDLKKMGVRPGPIYRRIFRQIRAARLDGEIHSRAEEEALAQALIEQNES